MFFAPKDPESRESSLVINRVQPIHLSTKPNPTAKPSNQPSNDNQTVPALFEAMSQAALLNPDPPEPGAEEGDDELIYDQAGLDLAGCSEEQVRGFLGSCVCMCVCV